LVDDDDDDGGGWMRVWIGLEIESRWFVIVVVATSPLVRYSPA